MMIGRLLQDLFSMVDLYFVSELGHVEVAALAIAGTVVAVLAMLVQGIAVGTMAFIAHFTGEGNHEMSDIVLGQTLILGIIGKEVGSRGGVLLSIRGVFFIRLLA